MSIFAKKRIKKNSRQQSRFKVFPNRNGFEAQKTLSTYAHFKILKKRTENKPAFTSNVKVAETAGLSSNTQGDLQ